MKVEIAGKEANEVKLKVEIPQEEVETALNQAYMKMRNEFSVPGFRKGKVPRDLIEKRYGVEVFYEEAANILLQQSYPKALDEQDLEPVARPDIDVEQLEAGKPFVYEAKVTVKPEVTLGKYQGFKVAKEEPKVEDKDVDAELDRIRDSRAKLVAVEEGQPAEKDDQVIIDFIGRMDGEEFEGGSSSNHPLVLGSGSFVPGFEDQLIGAKVGETVTVSLTMPEDYGNEELAGKEVEFTVDVKEVKRKEHPELNDEFAKELGEDFESLQALKDKIKDQLQHNADHQAEHKQRDEIIDAVRDKSKVDIPAVMVDDEVEAMVQQMENRFARQGMKLEDYLKYSDQDLEQLRQQMRPEAETAVKTELVLDQLAEKENIQVETEDLDKEIERLAQSYGQQPEQIKSALAGSGQMQSLEQAVLHRKVVDWLVEHNSK